MVWIKKPKTVADFDKLTLGDLPNNNRPQHKAIPQSRNAGCIEPTAKGGRNYNPYKDLFDDSETVLQEQIADDENY